MFNKTIPSMPIILGKIGSCYGTSGWLKLFSFTENKISIFNYNPCFVKMANQFLLINLEDWRYHNKNIIFKIKGINNRETARLFTNNKIIIDSSQLTPLNEGEYYWNDLIGCQVINIKGAIIGNVINIMETKSNDILVVKNKFKNKLNIKEQLIPFIKTIIVKEVNIVNKIIKVNWNL